MSIDTQKFKLIGGGPYVDKVQAQRQIDLYYKDNKGVTPMRDDQSGNWYIVQSREEEK